MTKLLNIHQLSEETGLPVRTIRSLQGERKIPFIKTGHRTVLFVPEKVRRALDRFEIREVGAK